MILEITEFTLFRNANDSPTLEKPAYRQELGSGLRGDRKMEKAAALPRLVPSVAAMLLACLAAGCWSDPAPNDALLKCASGMFPSYNAKDKDQCIAACIKCERGVVTTCATSCSLKGAK